MKLDGSRVQRARDRLGYTLEMVGEKSGVAKGTVLRAEHGEEIRPVSARRIAAGLGVEVADLVPGDASAGAPAQTGFARAAVLPG